MNTLDKISEMQREARELLLSNFADLCVPRELQSEDEFAVASAVEELTREDVVKMLSQGNAHRMTLAKFAFASDDTNFIAGQIKLALGSRTGGDA